MNIDIRIRNGCQAIKVSNNEMAPTITIPTGLFLEAVLVGKTTLPKTMIIVAREKTNSPLKVFTGTLPEIQECKVTGTETLRDGGSRRISFIKNEKTFELTLSVSGNDDQVQGIEEIHYLRRVYG